VVWWYRQPDVIECLEMFMLLEEVLKPSQEVLRHSQLHCMQQVGFREVTDNAVEIPENIRTSVDPGARKTCLRRRAIGIAEHSVEGVIPTLIRFDGKFAHFVVWAFAPVANAILDVVKVSVFWVVCDPGGGRCKTAPEVVIGTLGVE